MKQNIAWEERFLPIEVPVVKEQPSEEEDLYSSSPTFLKDWKNLPTTKGNIRFKKYVFHCDIYKVRETFVSMRVVLQKENSQTLPELYMVLYRNRTTGVIEFFNEKHRIPMGYAGKRFLERVIIDYKKELLDGFKVPSTFWEAQDELADPKERSHAPPF